MNGNITENKKLIFIKSIILYDNSEKILIFLLVISPDSLKIKMSNFYMGDYYKKKFQVIDVFLPWKAFNQLIEDFKSDTEEEKDDTRIYNEGKLWECFFDKLNEKELLQELSTIVQNNKDEQVASILINDLFTDLILENKMLDVENIDLGVEVFDPQQKKAQQVQEVLKKQEDKKQEFKNKMIIDMVPVVDPVKGRAVDKLRAGDIIHVKSKINNVEIEAPVFRIVPASSMERVSVTVKIDDDTFGNFIVTKNLKIKLAFDENEEKVNDYLFFIYILGAVLLSFVITIILYLLFS